MSTPLAKKVFELFGKPELAAQSNHEQRETHVSVVALRPKATKEGTGGTHPFINTQGELIIPFDCDPKYHYWKRGG